MTQKHFLEALIFENKLEGRLASKVHGATVGSVVTFFAGKHNCKWEVKWETTHPCASDMLRAHGHKKFIPNSLSLEHALHSYFELYGKGYSNMWEWDAALRKSEKEHFVAWGGQVVSYKFDGVGTSS